MHIFFDLACTVWSERSDRSTEGNLKSHLKELKILHTSDWHLGRALYGCKRYDEYEAFLNWMVALIDSEDIDVLMVAGDVFDNSTPSKHGQEVYFRFLSRVAASPNHPVAVKEGSKHSFACGTDIDYNHVKFRSYYNAKQDCHFTRES
jgi:metallophosphoesterase superfamily enzyme